MADLFYYVITEPAEFKGLEGRIVADGQLQLTCRHGGDSRTTSTLTTTEGGDGSQESASAAAAGTAPMSPLESTSAGGAGLGPAREAECGGGVIDDADEPHATSLILPVDTLQLMSRDVAEQSHAPQWYFRHARTGWRAYAPAESHIIEEAYQAGARTVTLSRGGKVGNDYKIRFTQPLENFTEPHDGCQHSSSGSRRAIRRMWYSPGNVSVADKEAWFLLYPSVPQSFVTNIFDCVHDDRNNFTEKDGHRVLSENEDEFHRNEALEYFSKNPQRLDFAEARQLLMVEDLKYGRHAAFKALLRDAEPVDVVEWWHRTGYRSMRGADCELILDKVNDPVCDCVILNGGRPMAPFPARPIQIQFNKQWFRSAKDFALHTQLDLTTRNRRGIRVTTKYPSNKDYLYYTWIRRYRRSNAMEVYKIYMGFLKQVAQVIENISQTVGILSEDTLSADVATARQQTERLLQRLDDSSTWTAPPEEEIPAKFLCPLTFCLMEQPTYFRGNPRTHRIEGRAFRNWVQLHKNHPLTRETINNVGELETDEDLLQEMVDWMCTYMPQSQPSTPMPTISTPITCPTLPNASGGGMLDVTPTGRTLDLTPQVAVYQQQDEVVVR